MVSRSIVPRSVETAPGGLARRVQCEVLRTDESAFAKNGRALERVAELADVARPVVPEQRLPGVPREARRRTRDNSKHHGNIMEFLVRLFSHLGTPSERGNLSVA
jgi:hypothetical protein